MSSLGALGLILRLGLSLNLELTSLAELASFFLYSSAPGLELYRHIPGFYTGAEDLTWQALYPLSHLLNPLQLIFVLILYSTTLLALTVFVCVCLCVCVVCVIRSVVWAKDKFGSN